MSLGFESNGTLRKEKKKLKNRKCEYSLQSASSNISCAEVKHFPGYQPSLGGVVLEEGVQVGMDTSEETAAVFQKVE